MNGDANGVRLMVKVAFLMLEHHTSQHERDALTPEMRATIACWHRKIRWSYFE